LRSLQNAVQTDNSNANKQEPATGQIFPATHTSSTTHRSNHCSAQLQHNEEGKALKKAKDCSNNKRNRKGTTYFCISHSNIWSEPVHSMIKTVKDKFNHQWLRVSVSCHRFTNLGEIFQGVLSRKLTVRLTSQDFEALPCSCRTRGNGACCCNNMCKKIQQQSTKSNSTTQEKNTWETHNKI